MSHPFDTLIVYTTEEGGMMSVRWSSREEYEEARITGRLDIREGRFEPNVVDLKMVAFAPVEDMRDFVLDPVKEMSA